MAFYTGKNNRIPCLKDIVVWYRVGNRHVNPNECTNVGLILKPFGSW